MNEVWTWVVDIIQIIQVFLVLHMVTLDLYMWLTLRHYAAYANQYNFYYPGGGGGAGSQFIKGPSHQILFV